jgi:phosphoglycolate phosphatase
MNKKYIIWDWNGTLIDDIQLTCDIANAMQAERCLPFFEDVEAYRRVFCFPILEYYHRMGFIFQEESFEEVSVDFVARYEAHWRLLNLRAGAMAALQAARRAGLRQTVLSATRCSRLTPQVEHFGVVRYVDEILGIHDDLAHSKVHLAVEYLARNNINPAEVVFIGDTDHDYAVAKSVGSDCLLLTEGHQSVEILSRCGVPLHKNPLEAIKSIL